MSSTMPPLPSNPREDAGPRILGATLTTTCMAIVVVLTRFYVRRFMIRAIGWDDVVMLSALLLVRVLSTDTRHSAAYANDSLAVSDRRSSCHRSDKQWRWTAYRRCRSGQLRSWHALQLHHPANLPLGYLHREDVSWIGIATHSDREEVQSYYLLHNGLHAVLHIRLFYGEFLCCAVVQLCRALTLS